MKTDKPAVKKTRETVPKKEIWLLRLYVAGQTPRSLLAFANLERICKEHLAGKYQIEEIDLLKNPQLAKDDQIFAIPTLVRKFPEPIKKIVGDLSNLKNPQLAKDDQIFAIPTLVRKFPEPIKKIVGDLSNTVKVLVGLDLRPK